MQRGRMPAMKTERREYLRVPVLFPVTFSGEKFDGEGTSIQPLDSGMHAREQQPSGNRRHTDPNLQTEEYRPPITIDLAVVRSGIGKRLDWNF